MLKRVSLLVLVGCVFISMSLAIAGCGKGENPATPPTPPTQDMQTGPAAGNDHSGSANNQAWGFYFVTIDPDSFTADAVPLRTAEFTCNVTMYMQPPLSAQQLLKIEIDPVLTDFDTGYVVADVTFSHPFPGVRMYRGFDVLGIVMGNGSLSLTTSGVTYAGENDLRLLNPDGFTRWWNPSEFDRDGTVFGYLEGKYVPPGFMPTATLNGYKYFADELGPNENMVLEPANRGTFATTPGVNTRRYVLQFPDGELPAYNFAYAIDASWDQPDPDYAPYYPIEAFGPYANCAEPYMVKLTDAGSSAWYMSDDNRGGSLLLDVEVYDWQTADNPDGITGELAGLWLESDILDAPVDILESAELLPGGPTSGVFHVQLDDLNMTHPGEYEIWIVAESASPASYEPNIPQPTSPFTWPEGNLACYSRATVEVSAFEPMYAPVVTGISPGEGMEGVTVPATISGSFFKAGCVAQLISSGNDGQTVIDGDNVEVYEEGTKIDCDFDLAGVPDGLYDVLVINPGGMNGLLPEGFEVISTGWVIYVDSSNTSGLEDGTQSHPYATIQAGINSADAGCVVWVDDSDEPYDERILMADSVDVISVNWDDSDGDEEAWVRVPTGFSYVVMAADNSRLEGFDIDGANGLWNAMIGILIDGVNAEIVDCRVHDLVAEGATGIRIINNAQAHIDGCEVYEITNGTYYQGAYFYGILVDDCNVPVLIEHTVVHDVYADGFYDGNTCRPHGIMVKNSSGARVMNSIVYTVKGGYNNQVYGLKVEGSDGVELVNNVVFDIYKTFNYGNAYGVRLEYSNNVDVRNNIFYYIRRSLPSANAYCASQLGSTYTFEYNDSYFCSTSNYDNVEPGPGCISANPQFYNISTRDFHLHVTSPCVNAGDPKFADSDGSECDMGAYGGPGGVW